MSRMILAMLASFTACAAPQAARADDVPPQDLTVTGSVTLTSDYRLRGISFSDREPAIQGSLTVSHKSGLYVGTWASSQAGYGSFGGANMEVDLLGGYTRTLGKTTLDAGLAWYFFPGTSGHQWSEIYASVSHRVGPVKAKIGANHGPRRRSIGTGDNLWVYGDLVLPIAGTPIALRSHVGYTVGSGSIYGGPRGHYVDYSAGADLSWKNLTFSASYVGTDINRAEADAYYTYPGTRPGRSIVRGAAVVSLTAAF